MIKKSPLLILCLLNLCACIPESESDARVTAQLIASDVQTAHHDTIIILDELSDRMPSDSKDNPAIASTVSAPQ